MAEAQLGKKCLKKLVEGEGVIIKKRLRNCDVNSVVPMELFDVCQ